MNANEPHVDPHQVLLGPVFSEKHVFEVGFEQRRLYVAEKRRGKYKPRVS